MDFSIVFFIVVCLILAFNLWRQVSRKAALQNEVNQLHAEKNHLGTRLLGLEQDSSQVRQRNSLLENQSGLKDISLAYSTYADLITELLDGELPKMGDPETMFSTLSEQERKQISPALAVEQRRGMTELTAQEFDGIKKMREIFIRLIIAVREEKLKMIIMPRLFAAHVLVYEEMMKRAEELAPRFAHNSLFFDEFCLTAARDIMRVRGVINPNQISVPEELIVKVQETFAPLKKAAEARAKSLDKTQTVPVIRNEASVLAETRLKKPATNGTHHKEM